MTTLSHEEQKKQINNVQHHIAHPNSAKEEKQWGKTHITAWKLKNGTHRHSCLQMRVVPNAGGTKVSQAQKQSIQKAQDARELQRQHFKAAAFILPSDANTHSFWQRNPEGIMVWNLFLCILIQVQAVLEAQAVQNAKGCAADEIQNTACRCCWSGTKP